MKEQNIYPAPADLVYLKVVVLCGERLIAIYSFDGLQLTVARNEDIAVNCAINNGFTPVMVH